MPEFYKKFAIKQLLSTPPFTRVIHEEVVQNLLHLLALQVVVVVLDGLLLNVKEL